MFLNIQDFFSALFSFAPLQYGIIAGIFIGFMAPLLGSVVVIRRLSFIADTLSHFSLAGVTIGVFVSKLTFVNKYIDIDPLFMGIIFSVIGTFLIEKLRGFYKNYKELSMPIVMSFGVALSGLFISLTTGISTNFTTNILFGSIYSVSLKDIILILIFSSVIIVLISLFYKKIVTLCFDEVYAKVSGINVKLIQLSITIVLSLFISIFIDLVGVLLISALLIVPVATSILVGKSFKSTLRSSIIFSEISILLGFYISYEFNWPTGSTVVLINIIILIIVMSLKGHKVKKGKEEIQNE